MALIELKVPDIGDFDEVEVIELLVSAGDTVTLEQSLLTVESDKASMEIPSSSTGRIVELKVGLGDKVAQGSVIAVVETADAMQSVQSAQSAATFSFMAEMSGRDAIRSARARASFGCSYPTARTPAYSPLSGPACPLPLSVVSPGGGPSVESFQPLATARPGPVMKRPN